MICSNQDKPNVPPLVTEDFNATRAAILIFRFKKCPPPLILNCSLQKIKVYRIWMPSIMHWLPPFQSKSCANSLTSVPPIDKFFITAASGPYVAVNFFGIIVLSNMSIIELLFCLSLLSRYTM